jgi:hypothetical protein
MSGGYLKKGLGPGEHQVVIFTFRGPIDAALCVEWNIQIKILKGQDMFGDQVMAATMKCDDTPGANAFKRPKTLPGKPKPKRRKIRRRA